MKLTLADWLVVAAYFLMNLIIGLYYRKKASASTDDFFVSGREVSWWLAGTSMVATTFAADTPLLVAGLVARQGWIRKIPAYPASQWTKERDFPALAPQAFRDRWKKL